MTVKKGDLVKLKNRPSTYLGMVLDWEFALVLKGPYEHPVTITDSPFPVTVIELVCDVIFADNIYKAIPTNRFVRHSQTLPDAFS
jgi:hypothetical protein